MLLCWIILESEAFRGFYAVRVVSSSLALSGAQYCFDLEGTLGVQDPSKQQTFNRQDGRLCAGYLTKQTAMDIIQAP